MCMCHVQGLAPASLQELLAGVSVTKRRLILQRMAVHLVPIMEKGMVDPVLTHRSTDLLSSSHIPKNFTMQGIAACFA